MISLQIAVTAAIIFTVLVLAVRTGAIQVESDGKGELFVGCLLLTSFITTIGGLIWLVWA